MFQKKKKCGVCGYRFAPKKEEVYTAEEPRPMVECLTKAPTRFSAIDCPRCGCQIALAIRVPRVNIPNTMERKTEENLKPFDYVEQALKNEREVADE